MKLYPLRKKTLTKPKPIAKLYSLEPKDCYTIGEITEKFLVNESTVYLHIRKYSIPTRQIGNFVYVPKKEIDNLNIYLKGLEKKLSNENFLNKASKEVVESEKCKQKDALEKLEKLKKLYGV